MESANREMPGGSVPQGAGNAEGRPVARIGALLVWSLVLFGLTGIIRWIAGDAAGMRDGMLRWAPPAATGFPEAAYGGVAEMLTGYLTGSRETFQYTLLRGDGEGIPCFHEHEAAHMADVRGLIQLDTLVWILCGVAALLLLVAGIRRIRSGGPEALRALVRGGWRGMLVLGLVITALLIWACIDFDGLFITFHRVAFRNDLWLLDPRTDLLIRLMPQELFIHLGMKGLAAAVAWIGLLCAGLGLCTVRRNGK